MQTVSDKNSKRNIVIIMALCLSTAMLILSASKVWEYSFKNSFIETGKIEIELKQLELGLSGEKKEVTPNKLVAPGEKTSYIPQIKNLKNDCYVRVKIEIEMNQEDYRPVTMDNIIGLGEDWIQKNDGYIYYENILEKDDVEEVFQEIEIPKWEDPTEEIKFDVNVIADAIQAKNFTPNFDSEIPWGSVEIKEAKTNDNVTIKEATKLENKNELIFNADAGFEATTDDLFSNFGQFMPGDTCTDTLTIKNNSNKEIIVYFKNINLDKDALEDEMLLKITCSGSEIYNGNLYTEKIGDYIELGKIKANDSLEFVYEITLPKEADNNYSDLRTNVDWQFKAVSEGTPKTGDVTRLGIWFAVMIAAIFGIVYSINSIRKVKKQS